MGRKISVILVDDEPDLLNLIKILILLWRPDSVVETALNGHEALKKIKVQKFDFLVTDYDMPILDGLGLIKALEKMGASCWPTNILMLSGYVEPGDPPPGERFITYMPKELAATKLQSYFESCKLEDVVQVEKNLRENQRVVPLKNAPIRIDILGDGFVEIVKARDISLMGVGISSPHHFSDKDLEKEIEFIMTVPGERPFTLKGMVKHVGRGDKRYFGLKFLSLAEEHKEKLKKYILARIN